MDKKQNAPAGNVQVCYNIIGKVRMVKNSSVAKECALCGTMLAPGSDVSICRECLKCADCCVGLEKLDS